MKQEQTGIVTKHIAETEMASDSALRSDTRSLLKDWPKRLIIDGRFVDAMDGTTLATEDPGTGETIATVASAGPEDVELAVRAARKGLRRWPLE